MSDTEGWTLHEWGYYRKCINGFDFCVYHSGDDLWRVCLTEEKDWGTNYLQLTKYKTQQKAMQIAHDTARLWAGQP